MKIHAAQYILVITSEIELVEICSVTEILGRINCTSRNNQGPFATGKIRQNLKFAAFWSVFLKKIKVDPESWLKNISIKQLRKKKIPKNNLTQSRSTI